MIFSRFFFFGFLDLLFLEKEQESIKLLHEYDLFVFVFFSSVEYSRWVFALIATECAPVGTHRIAWWWWWSRRWNRAINSLYSQHQLNTITNPRQHANSHATKHTIVNTINFSSGRQRSRCRSCAWFGLFESDHPSITIKTPSTGDLGKWRYQSAAFDFNHMEKKRSCSWTVT